MQTRQFLFLALFLRLDKFRVNFKARQQTRFFRHSSERLWTGPRWGKCLCFSKKGSLSVFCKQPKKQLSTQPLILKVTSNRRSHQDCELNVGVDDMFVKNLEVYIPSCHFAFVYFSWRQHCSKVLAVLLCHTWRRVNQRSCLRWNAFACLSKHISCSDFRLIWRTSILPSVHECVSVSPNTSFQLQIDLENLATETDALAQMEEEQKRHEEEYKWEMEDYEKRMYEEEMSRQVRSSIQVLMVLDPWLWYWTHDCGTGPITVVARPMTVVLDP